MMTSTLMHFKGHKESPRVPQYKTKKKCHAFLNKILACQVPSSSILVGPLVLLKAVRNGRFDGGWLSNLSLIFNAALNWAKLPYYFHNAVAPCYPS